MFSVPFGADSNAAPYWTLSDSNAEGEGPRKSFTMKGLMLHEFIIQGYYS